MNVNFISSNTLPTNIDADSLILSSLITSPSSVSFEVDFITPSFEITTEVLTGANNIKVDVGNNINEVFTIVTKPMISTSSEFGTKYNELKAMLAKTYKFIEISEAFNSIFNTPTSPNKALYVIINSFSESQSGANKTWTFNLVKGV
jgi:hypothetical protein